MRPTPISFRVRAGIATVLGLLEPYAEVAYKCRSGLEHSEACVWGRAFMPLGRWLAPLIIIPILFVGLTLVSECWRIWKEYRAR